MTKSRGQFEESKDAIARADSTLQLGKAKALSLAPPEPRNPKVEPGQEPEAQALANGIDPVLRGQARPAAPEASRPANDDTPMEGNSSRHPLAGASLPATEGQPNRRVRYARKSAASQRNSKRSFPSPSKLGELVSPTRCLPRQDDVRIARYSRFPREHTDELPRIGFTRDVSALGMCLGVDHAEPIGVLLRIELRSLDGESMGASIARVVWCKDARDGRRWLGLDLLCDIEKPDLQTQHG